MNYLSFLECTSCNKRFPTEKIQTYCLECKQPLLARYDLDNARQALDRDQFQARATGMWRWHELLPVLDPANQISLGEGDTPLLLLERLGKEIRSDFLFVKDESLNPTGSFKARGLSAAISKAKELDIRRAIIPSAGNAAGALAAYAARAGIEACVIMPDDSPRTNIEESRITGAEVILIHGLINHAAQLSTEKARSEGWFDFSTFKEPYRCEGKKIMGYELAEEFKWHLPDVIIYPTGGGTGLVGMWKAFLEMQSLGWLESDHYPRMVVVQAQGCAPVVKAFEEGTPSCELWQDAHTIASGLRVPKSFADQIILEILQESQGIALAVSDEAIIDAQKLFASREGIFAAPEGAATVAGLIKLLEIGWIEPEERVVIFNTGAGLKYL